MLAVTTHREREYDAHLVGAFVSKHDAVEVRGRIKVHHAPTNGNYWHITLDTYRPNSKEFICSIGDRQNADKQMFKALKQDLRQRLIVDEKPHYSLSRREYVRFFYLFLLSSHLFGEVI